MMQRTATDDAEQKVLDDIARYGWHCLNIHADGDDPPWAFTIGLFETWQHPELITIGLGRDVAHRIFAIVVDGLRQGHHFDLGEPTNELLQEYPCRFVEVSADYYRAYVGFARWYYQGNAFPLYQIVWPSKSGHFPWDPGSNEAFKQWQPLLGQPPTGA